MHMLCQQLTFEEAESILEAAIETNPDLVIDEDWLQGMKEANRGALQSMTNIAQFNESQIASSATVVTSEEE